MFIYTQLPVRKEVKDVLLYCPFIARAYHYFLVLSLLSFTKSFTLRCEGLWCSQLKNKTKQNKTAGSNHSTDPGSNSSPAIALPSNRPDTERQSGIEV